MPIATTPQPQTQTSTDRQAEILAAVDHLIAEHDRWVADHRSDDLVPPSSFDDAVSACSHILLAGPIPAEASGLASAASVFLSGWDRYLDRDLGFVYIRRDRQGRNPQKCPVSTLWTFFRSMQEIRATIQGPVEIQRESVSQLLSEGVSPENVAKAFGTRDDDGNWTGPFFENGKADRERVSAQAAFEQGEPGGRQILGDADYTTLVESTPPQADAGELHGQLEQLRERTAEDNFEAPAPADKGTPEELILGGAFPHQVKKAFGLSTDEERAIRERLGVDDYGQPLPEPSPNTLVAEDPEESTDGLEERIERLQARAAEIQEQKQKAASVEVQHTIGDVGAGVSTEAAFSPVDDDQHIGPATAADEPTGSVDAGFFDDLAESSAATSEPISQDRLTELVVEEHQQNESLSPSEIAERLSVQTGQPIDGRAVAGVIAKHKREREESV